MSAATEQKVPIWHVLGPEELVARGLCPVKREHVRVLHRVLVPAGGEGSENRKGATVPRKGRDDRSSEVCHRFLRGECTFGDKCRYSHDVDGYLTKKEPDLPGTCPVIHALKDQGCPYGIACRWASSHAQEHGAAVEAAPARPETVTVCGEIFPDDGSIPVGTLPVRPLETVAAEVNYPSKNLQKSLRKGEYPFTVASRVLAEMGVRDKRSEKRRRDGKGAEGKGRQGPAAATGPEAGVETGAAVTAGDADGGQASKRGREHASEAAQAAGDALDERLGDDDAGLVVKRLRDATGQRVAGAAPAEGNGENAPAAEEVKLFDVSRASMPQSGGVDVPLRPSEKRRIDWKGKTYLAPLTTVGNLPFRRVCKAFGVDITIGEMALATNLLQGHAPEWALLRRHPSEDLFGVQICGGFPDAMCKVSEVVDEVCNVDFVDINMGCPIDLICNKGAGSALLRDKDLSRMEKIVRGASQVLSCPLTFKIRRGFYENKDIAHEVVQKAASWGAEAVTLHGRTRQQRYSRLADWDYIRQCAAVSSVPLIGNGDVYSWRDAEEHLASGGLATVMVARGGLIKPWIFTEIKERRDWDISGPERLDMLKDFVRFGLEHWGSDARGVETTRRFLLEWLSFLHRYVPVGLLEVLPPRMHLRPPAIYGRSQLETLLASDNASDWVRISEMLLGPVPSGFSFAPKHKTNSYVVSQTDVEALGGQTGATEEGDENG